MPSLKKPVEAVLASHATYSEIFPCQPSTAETGRKLVRDVLGIWNLDDLADRAELVITELIANASRHTPCPEIRLVVGRPSATRVRVGIVDEEPSRLPVLSHAGEEDESGRGLLLIDAVADRWGCDLQRSGRRLRGKEVWAELRTGEDE
ncbi:ATP-binding protein [Streptomyces sp. NBC_00053]|uniref:ATP-binding protein n=1 Tax=unclassified Streptomyces TaxID=2593676 RepID=UPI002250A85C|nr:MULTISPECIES: ATP-binding protein [unclassified Streptomyces]MCX5501101.1 ATP-binding protein [Streptomyces sp. NBC_00052]MCX5550364.1 ATP-binding protein [Streptomyces sp. NBC_00051]WSP48468.1 ATP-binding protein [Streptomyces sp. NBC_01243]